MTFICRSKIDYFVENCTVLERQTTISRHESSFFNEKYMLFLPFLTLDKSRLEKPLKNGQMRREGAN